VDDALPPDQLSPLMSTLCPLDRAAILRPVLTVVACYQELARKRAHRHGIQHPVRLERLMIDRLQALHGDLGYCPGGDQTPLV
jgi:hypothetical protein